MGVGLIPSVSELQNFPGWIRGQHARAKAKAIAQSNAKSNVVIFRCHEKSEKVNQHRYLWYHKSQQLYWDIHRLYSTCVFLSFLCFCFM